MVTCITYTLYPFGLISDAHNYFVEYISKAYQALTDPISRENYEKYGHPDGRQVFHENFGEHLRKDQVE